MGLRGTQSSASDLDWTGQKTLLTSRNWSTPTKLKCKPSEIIELDSDKDVVNLTGWRTRGWLRNRGFTRMGLIPDPRWRGRNGTGPCWMVPRSRSAADAVKRLLCRHIYTRKTKGWSLITAAVTSTSALLFPPWLPRMHLELCPCRDPPRDRRVGGCTRRQDGSLQGVPIVQRHWIHRSESGFYPSPLRTTLIFPLKKGLRTLSNLENLYLRIPNFLPNLHAFSTYHTGTYSPSSPPSSTATASSRTSTSSALLPGPGSLPLLHLPRLRFYRECTVYATRLIVSPRGLVRANIWDALPGTDLDALHSTLGDATAPSTPLALTFLWDRPQTALFAPLAKHISQTRALTAGRSWARTALNPRGAGRLCQFSAFDFDNVESDPAPVHVRFVRGQRQHLQQPVRHSIAGDAAALMACPTLLTSRLHGRNWARYSGEATWNPVVRNQWVDSARAASIEPVRRRLGARPKHNRFRDQARTTGCPMSRMKLGAETNLEALAELLEFSRQGSETGPKVISGFPRRRSDGGGSGRPAQPHYHMQAHVPIRLTNASIAVLFT
ncbi:hypothetical protein DFH08DRAFT_797039 [Mycena albidolilacea]|uniref:Uncharacterized protein n=1 Tax=Mycena albidolilacea TaxID=1033008 RepID=A0AAD7F264_9AGAR|nr:hypothetical protein DFH08DRAFT_797039 [Mycena albidolilacea]